jgi:hypothetical protein
VVGTLASRKHVFGAMTDNSSRFRTHLRMEFAQKELVSIGATMREGTLDQARGGYAMRIIRHLRRQPGTRRDTSESSPTW